MWGAHLLVNGSIYLGKYTIRQLSHSSPLFAAGGNFALAQCVKIAHHTLFKTIRTDAEEVRDKVKFTLHIFILFRIK